MITNKKIIKLIFTSFLSVLGLFLTSCNENAVEQELTDDEFIKQVITNGYTGGNAEDDDLFKSEVSDFDDGEAVGNSAGDTPIDSLIKWGRKVTGSSVNVTINSEGDSIKNVNILRTITGKYIIIGIVNGQADTIEKPYVQEFRRKAVFKRIANTPRPRQNWRLYKVSLVDGRTISPQNSDNFVQMQQIQAFVNGVLRYTFQGPDFTQNIFTTRWFSGQGIPEVNIGDEVRLVVTTSSAMPEQDIVAWHWGKRNFGFHREPFVMVTQIPGGLGWIRTYEKTFTIGTGHLRGRFNGFISASTRKSLYDDSPNEFASDAVGIPYRVMP